jgi:elongator complex protein 3
VRDFSAHDVAAGTHTANLREVAERALAARGARVVEIRSREVRGRAVEARDLRFTDTAYATSIGEEHFLEFATREDRIAAFARVALPAERAAEPELAGSALLREVHVYGSSLRLGERSGAAAQHAGLGRALVESAERLARGAGFGSLAVISSVGTRPYYRRLGFADGDLYQHRALS